MAPDLNSLPSSPMASATRPERPVGGGPGGSAKRPNILYIMADQLAAPQLKMYNPESQIKTPNLDGLAAKSVQFDSAYCPSPLCAPSRMSMITGLLPMGIGAYDNASQISSDIPTYAHYLRLQGYHTALAGKMHFIGDQLHGYETRLTSDIYPGDFGWAVNWDEPDTRLEWYHNASSILQAGTCIRSNQLDYDEEVMYKSTQFLYEHTRQGPDARPFSLTVSLTHPHDPYTIEEKYWDMYEGVDIELPKVRIPNEEQDPHSKRLLKVCDLWDQDFTDDQIKRAKRAWKELRAWTQERVARYVIEEAGDVYTREEREGGIENVRSGLKRPLEEPDESDDEDGDDDENEDEDVVMGDGAQSGAPQPGKVAGPEPEVFFWFSARGDFDLPRNVEFEKDAAKRARLAVAGGAPRIS
ncbi:hypothetical protein BN1723_002142 [Verticillium longisporum]|uniref:Sulfatase N-terminal domain-containing protein n=1 Tax=Verticillium longisporum TaxID=100787 RepID=A0A0G4KYX9_VERLO|nr:hypothetical protein BN1723_002142 [Verticillium longisporum]